MIQFSGSDKDGGRLVGIGLSRENTKRLLDGQPILLDLRPHGLVGSLCIMGGETEADMEREIRSQFCVEKPS